MIEAAPLYGFHSSFLRRLEHVASLSRRPMVGPSSGPRRSPRHGSSAEFADFREYAPGDDLRRVDWNAYARLERLFLKLFQEEEDLTVHLLLDASRSMDWGDQGPLFAAPEDAGPADAVNRADTNKLLYAKRTAAAL